MEKEQNSNRLCDLVKSRFFNKLHRFEEDRALRDLGICAALFVDPDFNDSRFFDPTNSFFDLLAKTKNTLLKDFNAKEFLEENNELDSFAQRFNKRCSWVNGEKIEDSETITWTSDIPEKIINEDDIILSFINIMKKDGSQDATDIVDEFEKDLLKNGIKASVIEDFIDGKDISYSDRLDIIKVFTTLYKPNYKEMNKNLFGEGTYIFEPLLDMFNFKVKA